MNHAPFVMDQENRDKTLDAIRKVCLKRGWMLLAAHVRTNHVHCVVDAEVVPDPPRQYTLVVDTREHFGRNQLRG